MLEVTALTTEQQLFLSHVNLQSFTHTIHSHKILNERATL